MSTPSLLLFYVAPVFFLLLFRASAASLHGVSPQDEKYFASAVIRCRDGSGSFSKDRLNDEFCDCLDGTDEPGTSACPQSKFYCKNAGDSPRFLFSSFVNDRICDCCDGTDEYESGINCPNTCQKMKNDNNFEESNSNLGENSVTNIHQLDSDDLFHKLKGLRIALILEIGFVIFILAFFLLFRRTRSRRRRYSLKY